MITRALEFHAITSIYNPDTILRVLDVMSGANYNTLVLHNVGLIEDLVYPGAYFGANQVDAGVHRRYRDSFRSLYKYNPRRRSGMYQNTDYIRWVARRARERGIDLYLNNKELQFPDALLELVPELVKGNVVCPSEPAWATFLETKYDELFSDIPELVGMITAPGTGESRLAISSSRCTCEKCAAMTPAAWYQMIVGSIYKAAKRHGKTLVIRDFVFDRKAQDELAQGISDLPSDIVICLKNTPHDYYPTFPHNPRIGDVGNHPQWIEFDAMAQYFGWGIGPALMTKDVESRLDFALSKNVSGLLVRVDWEALEGHSAFRTLNSYNIFAAGMLGDDHRPSDLDVYRAWTTYVGALRSDLGPAATEDALIWVHDLLEQAWPITSKAIYAHDCVFNDSSQFPVSVEHAYWLAEEKNSLQDWDPRKKGALAFDADNTRDLLAEKDAALQGVRRLRTLAETGHPGIDPRWHGELVHRFRAFEEYVSAFHLVAQAIFCTRHATELGDHADPQLVQLANDAASQMRQRADHFRTNLETDWYPAVILLNGDRMDALREDVERILHALPQLSRTR